MSIVLVVFLLTFMVIYDNIIIITTYFFVVMSTNQQLIDSLKKLELNDKEISVYLAVLDNKKSSLVPIAKQIKIPSTTAQYILEKLADKGLVHITEERGRKRYLTTAPEKVMLLLKKQRDGLEAQITSFNDILPDLMQRYNTSPFQPRIRTFQGENIREIYEDMLNQPTGEFFYTTSTQTQIEAVGQRFFNQWIKERIKRKVWAYGIRIKDDETGEDFHSSGPKNYRELRFAPEGFVSTAMIVIYGDNVGIITSAQEMFGVVITSKDYAQTMRAWFREVWERSTPAE